MRSLRRVCNSNVLVVRSVDFFRAIFVGFVRVSFRLFGSGVGARQEAKPDNLSEIE